MNDKVGRNFDGLMVLGVFAVFAKSLDSEY